jgi:hypothetical protein
MANPSPFRGPRERAQFVTAYDSIMRTWPVPFDERNVETACGQTHLVVSGPPSAPPIVLLHAASATSAMWSPIIAAMSRTYRCYCIDTITEANKSVATQRIYSVADHVDGYNRSLQPCALAARGSSGCPTAAGSPHSWRCTHPNVSATSYYSPQPEPWPRSRSSGGSRC